MEKHLELILKNLDGTITVEEQKMFQILLKSDVAFARNYHFQKNLDSNMRSQTVIQAPDSLLSNVLNQIAVIKKQYAKDRSFNSFAGIKAIGIGFSILIFISILVVLYASSPTIRGEYTYINNIMDNVFSFFGSLSKYSLYLLLIFPGLLLVWLDSAYSSNAIRVN